MKVESKAMTSHDRVNVLRGVYEDAHGTPSHPEPRIGYSDTCLRPPCIPWINEPVGRSSPSRRRMDQRRHIVIAADHSIECHDVGITRMSGQRNEITVNVFDAVSAALAGGFLTCRPEEGRRGLDADRTSQAALQQLELDAPNTASDVEQCHIVKGQVFQRVHEDSTRLAKALSVVPLELSPG